MASLRADRSRNSLHSRGLRIASKVEFDVCSSNTLRGLAMRVSFLVAAVAVLFAIVSVAEAQSTPASGACNLPHDSGVQQRHLTSGGRERSYRLFVPPRYDGRTPLPM